MEDHLVSASAPIFPSQTHPIDPRITPRTLFSFDPAPPPPLLTARVRFNFDGHLPGADSPKRSRSRSAEPKKKKRRTRFVTYSDDEEVDELVDDDEQGNESDSSKSGSGSVSGSKMDLIPKPKGQPGKPNSGGFSIDAELKSWGQDLERFKTYVKNAAIKELDASKSYTFQDKEKIKKMRLKVRKAFPAVKKYVNDWPFTEELKMVMKNSATRVRREKDKE